MINPYWQKWVDYPKPDVEGIGRIGYSRLVKCNVVLYIVYLSAKARLHFSRECYNNTALLGK
jgi:hypothetical protein